MDESDLEELLRQPEGERVEWKATVSDSSLAKIRRTVCAFANDLPRHRRPGVVVVGRRDDGSVEPAFRVTPKLVERLSQIGKDGAIVPFPSVSARPWPADAPTLLLVVVQPNPASLTRYDGRHWVRNGDQTHQASAAEERRLIEHRRAANLPFDARPLYTARALDLDLDRFRREFLASAVDPEVLRQNQRPVEQQLAAFRFADALDDTGALHPTPAGLLIVGRAPTRILPGAYVQFVRHDGPSRADAILAAHEVRGALIDALPDVDRLLAGQNPPRVDLSQDTERRHSVYPAVALRELVRNAVLHRDYESTNAPVAVRWFSDRVEIHSPGGPYGQVTPANFGQGATDYRNPHLAAALRGLGFVQRFGVGLDLARRALADNGNPPPEFQVDAEHVTVILRPAP